ncbi:MarR family winged helix-turn-helix transcriptional regulator [Thermohalobacter berrensis]|uniref:MarR family transcriptional regulator n=1 Tax=Thermohalobacter berrensis TaxID=99594 RepID=A0A419T164_9FIRM|nr:MarR family transcriptional regulator [Thermohalobacter berrensis]RKD31193.1 MarR family transcriptional regulator [Thermohalobacter berrensis]
MKNFTEANLLRELVRLLVRNLGILEKDEATCCGVTISQCHTIIEIGKHKEISLNDLATILNLDKSTISRTVNRLVKEDLAQRIPDENDRRFVKIMLTDKGKRIFKNIEKNMDDYYQRIFQSIPDDKKDQVIESLNILINSVKQNKCC